jgi:hypothetical protein
MRRLLALAALAAACTVAAPASAHECDGVPLPGGSHAGACVDYVCVDICAPEWHVSGDCYLAQPAPLLALCAAVDRVHVVI